MSKKLKVIYVLLGLMLSFGLHAEIELPLLFTDGMVLQRHQPIPVWGWARPGEQVEVQFKSQLVSTQADKDGKWSVQLKPEDHGGPFTLTVTGKNTLKIENVLVGEVWIASGQSNMEWPMSTVMNAEEELKDSNYPQIRQFLVEQDMAGQPKYQLKAGAWSVCSQKTIGDFTAVGYFFAKKLYKELQVPIGIINSTWGGTCVETWTSQSALKNSAEFSDMLGHLQKVDIDELIKKQREQTVQQIETLQGGKLNVSPASEVIKNNYNDGQWPEMELPNLWENQVLPNMDGVVWFRKIVKISEKDAGKEAVLELTRIDDHDVTYLNGVEIGETNQYDVDRVYKVPQNVLKAGKNVITIKVTDYVGGGGIYGDAAKMHLKVGGQTYSLSGNWKFNVAEAITRFSPNSYPSLLYNAMIQPLVPYAFKGVIWYQGEANVSRAVQYQTSFPLMIKDWRHQWNAGEFPFYMVQLSSFNEFDGDSNKGSRWAELREAQALTVDEVSNTAMCVTVDIGNPTDIHPRNKQDVGLRLAAIALDKNYGKKQIYQGPRYVSKNIQGQKIELTFDHVYKGFKVKDKQGVIKGFEIAGADQKFMPAHVEIKNGKLLVSNQAITNPVAVRYGWADDASACNVFNQAGFPMEPFRTDDWKLMTAKEAYQISY